MMDFEKQKKEFLTICRENIHREGLEDLLNWLQRSDFFTAPASTRYHGAYAGGLCQHSLDVYKYALRVMKLYDGELNMESLTVAALFHDVCKVNFYKEDKRNQKINGIWEEVPYYSIDEKFVFGGHGAKSMYQVQYFMKLTQEEAVAINGHMGFAEGESSYRNIAGAYTHFPLAWVIHVADEAASYLLDRN